MILFTLLISFIFSTEVEANSQVFIGKIPGQYLSLAKTRFYLGAITVQDRIITEIKYLKSTEAEKYKHAVHLKAGEKYLAIYPGLIDLHNHPKQCLLPLWEHAHGQFGNRHEWRDWSVYSHSLGGNMNPWSNNGKVEVAAAFRWAELQATVLGTTLMQGPRFYTNDFAISHVEIGDGYYNEKQNVKGDYVAKEINTQAPTDLFIADEMTFIYGRVRPKKTSGKSFHDALESVLIEECKSEFIQEIKKISTDENQRNQDVYNTRNEDFKKSPTYNKFNSVNVAKARLNIPYLFTKPAIKVLSNATSLEKGCGEKRGKDFDLYFKDYHPSIVNKILTLKHPNNSGMIAHLSEGRRKDPYNQIEFDIAKVMDLIVPGMNLVHAVGLDQKDLEYLAQNKVGIVWSPFSNLLLYGETLKVENALKLGVNIALGSDWTPTGSKSVLEEVKIAKNYVMKNKLSKIITDEVLYNMMTENPAKMIKKYENNSEDGRHGVGSLKVDGMASFIAVQIENENPHTNLIRATENEISLVVSAGETLYGNVDILQAMGHNEDKLDWVPVSYNFGEAAAAVENSYENLSSYLNGDLFNGVEATQLDVFTYPKAYVVRDVEKELPEILLLKSETGLNMAKPSDIQRVLQALLTTQSRNAHKGKEEFQVDYLPPLVSIADPKYKLRFDNFLRADGVEDEVELNYVYRLEWRREKQSERDVFNQNNPHLPPRRSVPYRLAIDYGLEYDLELGVVGY